MKTCGKCKVLKPLTDFNVNQRRADNLQTCCRACDNARTKKHYYDNRPDYLRRTKEAKKRNEKVLREYKSKTPCLDCGAIYPHYVMDFDHRDPTTKVGNITRMVRSASQKKLRDELAKCDLVCSNCHRERTHGGVPRGTRAPTANR